MFRYRKFLSTFTAVIILCGPLKPQAYDLKNAGEANEILSRRGEIILQFLKPDHVDFDSLTTRLSIDRVDADTITAYANEKDFIWFKQQSIPYKILTPPSLNRNLFTLKSNITTNWPNQYPSYHEYVAMMEQMASDYPEICQLVGFGATPGNHKLLALKISDNLTLTENEPVVFYTSSMHGDELLGYNLMLRLCEHLLANYSTDQNIAYLINHTEIWINPLANPDGAYFLSDTSISGAIRFNLNHTDLNRDFPSLSNPGDNLVRQPETMAMIHFMDSIRPVLAANFHGGAEVINYPWDTWYSLHADDAWYRYISRCYADTVHANSPEGYLTFLENGITNGNEWYEISGGRQDYTNYYLHGREVTIELSNIKIPPEDQLENYWNYNRKSLVQYLEKLLTGFSGTVTDSLTGDPLAASIIIMNHDRDNSHVISDAETGIFYRLGLPGSFSLSVFAPGYSIKYLPVSVNSGEYTHLNIALSSGFGIEVYPNPFTSHFYFTIPYGGSSLELRIVDMTGRTVKHLSRFISNPGLKEVRVNDLAPGSYILHICYNNQTWKFHVVKNP